MFIKSHYVGGDEALYYIGGDEALYYVGGGEALNVFL